MLIPTITKIDAKSNNGVFIITLNLKVNDDVLEKDVIDQNFSEAYSKRKNDTIAMIKERFRAQMQATIDEYKSTSVTPNATKIATAIIDIQDSLVL